MASPRLCSIPGCGKPHDARGWCKNHYGRWSRYGDPLAGRIPPNGEPYRFLVEEILPYRGDECITWPFGRTACGYGGINIKGRKMEAHRVVCIETYGPPPTSKHQAAHSCGNGHLGCVNPLHLRWATPAENAKDRERHGTIPKGEGASHPKLTKEQVLKIVSLRGTVTRREIAQEFNVSYSTIATIHTGKKWGWLTKIAAPVGLEERK